MEEDAVKREARLYAIEQMLCNLIAGTLALSPKPAEALDQYQTRVQQSLQRQTFPSLDAAQSDLFASEVESAARVLLGYVKAHLANIRQNR